MMPAAVPAANPAPTKPSASATTSAAPMLAPPTAPPPALAPAAPPPAASAPGTGATVAWWWLLPAALLGGLAVWFVLARRSRGGAAEPDFIPPRTAPKPADAEPGPASPPRPVPAPTPAPVDLALEPLRLSLTLVYATLQYRLVLTNRSAAPLGPLHVAADMISAHASLPEEAQLGLDGPGLELRHELASLGPGETAELAGELRLPLAAVIPIRAGTAALLVPLVRLRLEGAGPSRTTALVVGEPPVSPGGPLRPFRLDHGPRIFGTVTQRSLATAFRP